MSELFASNIHTVLIVEPVGAFRDALRKILKAIGFIDVRAVGSVSDAHALLEAEPEPPFWIITSPMLDQEVNALQLLAMIAGVPDLRDVRVSLLYHDSDVWCLPAAYAMGLLSAHSIRSKMTSDLQKSLQAMLRRMTDTEYDSTAVSATYLRETLHSMRDYQSLLSFERDLQRIYPKSARQLLLVAEAHFLLEQHDDARACLAQARFMSVDLAADVDKLYERFAAKDAPAAAKDRYRLSDLFNLRTCLVVDPDKTIADGVADALRSLGVGHVEVQTDGLAAYQWLEKGNQPSLIVMEWRLAGLSGVAFVQRVVRLGMHSVPIVVLSSLVKAPHRNLLRELGVAAVIDKPYHREGFLRSLVGVLRAGWMPTNFRVSLRRIQELLATGRLAEAKAMKEQLLASKDKMPADVRDHLEARFAYEAGDYERARSIVTALMQEDQDNLSYQDLLAKVLLKMGEFEAAVMCFRRADSMAPDNVDRICSIADALTEMGDLSRADETVEKARLIDATATPVLTSDVKIGLATEDDDRARRAFAAMDTTSSILAFMNNRAVAFARTGREEQSLALYQDALRVVPEEKREIESVLRYNLGLAYIRSGDMPAARDAVAAAAGTAGAKFKSKALSLLNKLEGAIARGITLIVDPAMSEIEDLMRTHGKAAPASQAALPVVPAKPGELCCHGIFVLPGAVDPRLAKLLEHALPFRPRGPLKRGETTRKKTSYN